ncbi:cell division protein ZipA [Alteromonas sp. C1M14]|uniref:cell division protein ZipA n=1 Tax=Alteromonas sp. C1M14 TaxID=2841567 RepID=UPI001C084C0B|nr:cell division protein ZipA [Alteromonas sp. C1M14]MBU2976990.1 cell division protein ZipA [Alteromonas sp. C1M14]
MDELRLSLLILGTCFILAVLAHGIWKIRKSSQSGKKQRIEPRDWEQQVATQDDDESHDDYDDLGLGKVRVVSSAASPVSADEANSDAEDQDVHADSQGQSDNTHSSMDDDETLVTPAPEPEPVKLYGSVITNPKPHLQASRGTTEDVHGSEPIPKPPEFLIKKEDRTTSAADDDGFSLDSPEVSTSGTDTPTSKETRKTKKRSTIKRRQEPKIGDDQMNINFDDSTSKAPVSPSSSASANHAEQEQEVLVINVKAQDDAPISGASLLPLLLTLGFKFGDQDIFHRHVNSNGKGPVLFSLANMFKPGVFDIDNLENFSTQGVSLFMILPIEGDAHQVFNMMHNAARKIADEFNGSILDGRRSVLTKQGLQQYMEKIREFERKRMIARH